MNIYHAHRVTSLKDAQGFDRFEHYHICMKMYVCEDGHICM